MSAQSATAQVQINNSPQAVIEYIANTENRSLYLSSLKSISNIEGESVGGSWTWCWTLLGIDFEGTAACTQHEAGQCYVFETKGGIESTFTYRTEADGEGTQLSMQVNFDLPESALSHAGINNWLASSKQQEADATLENLKTILDQ